MSSPNLKQGEIINNNISFQILEKLGTGGSAIVYKALSGGNEYALKTYFDKYDAKKSFMTELQINRKLLENRDPQNERYNYVCLSDNYFCHIAISKKINFYPIIVYPYYSCDLFKYITKHNSFNLTKTKELTKQIAMGLSLFHDLNLVHTDLKPENILIHIIDNKPILKIIDFGCVVDLNHTKKQPYFYGTYSYNAPEVLLDLPADLSADIWSLGCIIFELFTGDLLFHSKRDDESHSESYSDSESDNSEMKSEEYEISENKENEISESKKNEFFENEENNNQDSENIETESKSDSECESCNSENESESDYERSSYYIKLYNKINNLLASHRYLLGDYPIELAKQCPKYFTKKGEYRYDINNPTTVDNVLLNSLCAYGKNKKEVKEVLKLIFLCIDYDKEKRIKVNDLINML